METKYYVYMIRCKDNTLYTGYTNDVVQRFHKHQIGKGAKYTRGRGPLTLVYTETFTTKAAAMSREYELKRFSKKEKLELIHLFEKEGGNIHANSK